MCAASSLGSRWLLIGMMASLVACGEGFICHDAGSDSPYRFCLEVMPETGAVVDSEWIISAMDTIRDQDSSIPARAFDDIAISIIDDIEPHLPKHMRGDGYTGLTTGDGLRLADFRYHVYIEASSNRPCFPWHLVSHELTHVAEFTENPFSGARHSSARFWGGYHRGPHAESELGVAERASETIQKQFGCMVYRAHFGD